MTPLHLQRIKLEQFRLVTGSMEITGLAPGLTILHGPQESGKSTIATAIRAAFLERCGSSVHTDFQPKGDSGAAPTVELDFEFQGVAHVLKKTFVKRTRCDLAIGNTLLDSTNAEDHLADLFGFEFAPTRKNRPEYMGIPGLLWVEQGHHLVADPITYGATHIRGSLQRELAELTSSTGDALIERIAHERGELLTDTGGLRKNGPLHQVTQQEVALQDKVVQLEDRVRQYREDVDRYAELLPELDSVREQKPWEEMRRKRDLAKQQLDQATQLHEKFARADEDVERARRHLELTREQLEAVNQRTQDLTRDETGLQTAANDLLELEATAREAQRQLEQAERDRIAAADLRDQARAATTRRMLEGQLQAGQTDVERAQQVLSRAEEIARQVGELRTRAATLTIDPDAVERLGQIEGDLRVLQAKLESAATRLSYSLVEGTTVQAGDDQLAGTGERLLTSTTRLEIPNVGHLKIMPGGSADLGLHRAELHELRLERDRLVEALGVATHTAAVVRVTDSRDVARALEQQQALLREVAPSGLETLRELLAATHRVVEELGQQLQSLPIAPEVSMSAEEAQGAADRATAHHTATALMANQTGTEASHARVSLERRQEELQQLRSLLESAAHTAKVESLRQSVRAGEVEVLQLDQKQQDLSTQVGELDIEALELEIQRFGNAEEQTRERFSRLMQEKDRIESRLQSGEAFGLEEQLAQAGSELEAVSRRRGELQRRADALSHLLERLQAHRAELTRKLTEPLTKAIQPFLDILLPGTSARLEIDESLVPRQLVRGSGPATGAMNFESLSHGTKEQLSVVVRLAYAALLAEQGHPAMVMLDDQLVHSDTTRFEQMKKVILRASQHHQILVFTCHPERWQDAGAPMVDIRVA